MDGGVTVRRAVLATIACLLAVPVTAQGPDDWRKVATPGDRARLREWRAAWMSALHQVQTSPDAGRMARQDALFDPDRALTDPVPPVGTYRCRMYKLGSVMPQAAEFGVSSWGRCTIGAGGDDGAIAFAGVEGAQRPMGSILADTDARAIFLGTLMIGDERHPLRYGRDPERDMVGIVERVGKERWRIVLPKPRFQSTLDVIELLPAA